MYILTEIAELQDQADLLRAMAEELECQAAEKQEQYNRWLEPREEHEGRPPERVAAGDQHQF